MGYHPLPSFLLCLPLGSADMPSSSQSPADGCTLPIISTEQNKHKHNNNQPYPTLLSSFRLRTFVAHQHFNLNPDPIPQCTISSSPWRERCFVFVWFVCLTYCGPSHVPMTCCKQLIHNVGCKETVASGNANQLHLLRPSGEEGTLSRSSVMLGEKLLLNELHSICGNDQLLPAHHVVNVETLNGQHIH